MGVYVNQTQNGALGSSFSQKCEGLLKAGALEVEIPKKYAPNLICVVDNVFFAAAAYLYNENELREFSSSSDKRTKRYFVWDRVEEFAQ